MINDKSCNNTAFDQYLEEIKETHRKQLARIEYLQNEVKQLKEEYSKDEEIQKMHQKLNKMSEDLHRGFPISTSEQESIDQWCKEHDEKVHGLNTLDKKLKAGGCIGGRYTYHFVPTSIGTIGTIECSCGASFTFQNL